MPRFVIHTTNSSFASYDSGADYDRPEEAMAMGVRSALEIIADEVHEGKASTGVEIRVEQEDGTPVLRTVVALSVSSLLTGVPETKLVPD